jgi:hypothetical protein
MIVYYDARLHEWIKDFQKPAQKFADRYPEMSLDTDVTTQTLWSAIRTLFDRSSQCPNEVLVKTAHEIWNLYDERDFVAVCKREAKLARDLMLSIGFLGRLYTDFRVMVQAAERLPKFQELTIYPLDSLSGKKHKKGKEKLEHSGWTLGKTFESISKSLDDSNSSFVRPQVDEAYFNYCI